MKEPACCFIGHRPQEFHFGYDEEYEDCIVLKSALAKEIRAMLDIGVATFYTGLTLGADMWCAELVTSLREELPELGIKLVAVIPFEGQANRWSNDFRERYFSTLAAADDEIILHSHYTKTCMQECRRYMADNSTHLIAVYDGSAGSTKSALDYARSKNLTIVTIDPRTAGAEMSPPFRNFKLLRGKGKNSRNKTFSR